MVAAISRDFFACPASPMRPPPTFFRARLDHMIDLRHELAVLTSRMPWQQLEATLAHRLSRQAIAGKTLPGTDLFGETIALSARVNNAGRPRVPVRIMMALLYLQNAFNLSDEAVVARWAENPYWQYFSGLAYFEPRLPCDGSMLVKFRKLIGEEGVEELLAQTVQLAVQLKLIRKKDLQTVVVDTTVQSKAVARPTDSRLLEVARSKLVDAAKKAGTPLKQTFVCEGAQLLRKARGYAHARQFKRPSKAVSRQHTVLGRLLREVQRKQPETAGEEAHPPRASCAKGQSTACTDGSEYQPWRQGQTLRLARPRGGVQQQGQGSYAL